MSALLHFENVALRRGGRMVFENLDLRLEPGQALHLSGPNGSGKSSLIRLAAGLLRADEGRVERSAVALADDNLALDPELPLRRALAFWTTLESNLDRALAAIGLAQLADVPVRLLSSGQAKRATLARVIAARPPLWLLDEPLNGLDLEGVHRLELAIEAHLQSGGAVLVASHTAIGGSWTGLELGR